MLVTKQELREIIGVTKPTLNKWVKEIAMSNPNNMSIYIKNQKTHYVDANFLNMICVKYFGTIDIFFEELEKYRAKNKSPQKNHTFEI